jgi:hypothetical protein
MFYLFSFLSLGLYYETKCACLNSVLIHACVILYEPKLLMYSYAYYLSMCMLIMLLSILLLMDDACKKEKTPFCAKTGIVMPLLIFKIQCTNSMGVSYFNELSNF